MKRRASTWWRLRREKASSQLYKTRRRQVQYAFGLWLWTIAPLAFAQRVCDHGHRRHCLRAALASWRDSCAALRSLYYGYVSIASRVGYRVALSCFDHWMKLGKLFSVEWTARHLHEQRMLQSALGRWDVAVSTRSADLRQIRARAQAAAEVRRLAQLRAALGEWGRQSRREGAWRGLVQGSDVAVAQQKVDAALRKWRELAADNAMRRQHEQLAAIAGRGRRTGGSASASRRALARGTRRACSPRHP